MLRAILCLFILCIGLPVAANNVPSEFESFFVEREAKVTISLAGDERGIVVDALINYERFKLQDTTHNIKKLSDYLTTFSLKPAVVESLIETLQHGVKNDAFCRGSFSRCNLNAKPNQPRFVYDYDGLKLKLFTSARDLTQVEKSLSYHDVQNDHGAFINWLDVNMYSDLNGNDNLILNNDTSLGLPLGFLTFDTQYRSEQHQLETYSALYDVAFSDQRIQVGRHRYNLAFNSTDFLTNNANLNGESFSWGSSTALLKGRKNRYQSIDFIAPQNAQLQVYRDERLILSKTVQQGPNSLNYSELPTGTYEIQLILKVGANEVINETREVVNVQEYALNPGDYDFVFGFGRLDDISNAVDETLDFERSYGRGAITYRYNEATMLAFALTTNEQDVAVQLGAKVYLTPKWALNYFNAISPNHAYYHQLRLSHGAFYLDTQLNKRERDDSAYDLMAHLYGKQSYRSVAGGWSGKVYSGSAFARYHVQSFSLNNQDKLQRDLSLGWSRGIGRHHFTFNVDWKQGDIDEVAGFFTWRYRFGRNVSLSSTTAIDEDGFRNNASSMTYQAQGEKWQNQTTLGGFTDGNDNRYAEVSNTFSAHNQYFNTDSYFYANNENQQNLSVSFSGTQIISEQGIDFTKEKSKSFIKVIQPQALQVDLMLSQEGEFKRSASLSDESKIIALSEYQALTINADGGVENTHVSEGGFSDFILPASMHQLVIEAQALKSDIIVLTKKDGSVLSWVQCESALCHIEPLSQDGVYRINYPDAPINQAPVIKSEHGRCTLLNNKGKQNYLIGHCP